MNDSNKNTSRERISRLVYVPVFASFIPIIGIPFSISAILWGASDWKIGGKKVAIIASLGLLFTLIFGWYAYFLTDSILKSPNSDTIKVDYTQKSLASILRYIEFYKLGHGHYPRTLTDLKENDIFFPERSFTDPFSYPGLTWMGEPDKQNYFYAVHENENSYVLFSVGADKTPFTQDDIYPIILNEYKSVIGLQVENITSP